MTQPGLKNTYSAAELSTMRQIDANDQNRMNNTPLTQVQSGSLVTWDGSRAVTNVVVDGPLKDLEQNKYKTSMLSYPKDLGSMAKGHTIQFDIRDVDPVTTSVAEIKGMMSEIETGISGIKVENSVQGVYNATKEGYNIVRNVVDKSALGQQIKQVAEDVVAGRQVSFKPPLTKDIIDSIRLYMPDTMNFSYNAQYDKLSLAEAINSVPLVATVSSAATSILNNNMVKLATQKIGYVFNPQQQMLFEGIDFREFELEFTFTPTSPNEAAMVNTIIKKLRRAAAPTINKGSEGFFFTPPSVFNISFLYNGQINTNIQQTRPCVLQSINVNYAPNGWAALSDGTPVQTVISLSFKEIELVDRQSIEDEL